MMMSQNNNFPQAQGVVNPHATIVPEVQSPAGNFTMDLGILGFLK